MIKRLAILITLLFFTSGIGYAIDLPRTGQIGQNTVYSAGDDGDIRAGLAWPSPRFTDNGDGTLTDNLTGLVWLQNANCYGQRSWANLVADANTLANGLCDLSDGSVAGDWRLSNMNELHSLLDADDISGTSLTNWGFTNVQASVYYMPSTAYAPDTTQAWSILFGSGYMKTYDKTLAAFYMLAVRGTSTGPAQVWRTGQTTSYATGDDGDIQAGAAWPSPRFTDNGDGTVTDNLTTLIWLKDADCFGVMNNWNEALGLANTLANGACSLTDGSVSWDWRLPNRVELRSLMDYSNSNPALPSGHPFLNLANSSRYWTSTYYTVTSSFYVHTFNGSMFSYNAANDNRLWPVRDGGVVTTAPDITVSLTSIVFGDVTENTSQTTIVTVTNDGNEDLVLGNIAVADPLAAPFSTLNDNCSGQTLTPAANCAFVVEFAPTTIGPFNDSFDIPSNDPDEDPVTVNVSGTGTTVTAPEINVTDTIGANDDLLMPFGDVLVGLSSTVETVTILNAGNAALNVSSIQLTGADTGEYSLDINGGASPCGATPRAIAVSDDCTVTIIFSPTLTGIKTVNLEIISDDSDDGTVNVALSGTGTAVPAPEIDVTDSIGGNSDFLMPFGNITEGLSSTAETATISNVGTIDLNVSGIQLTGAHTGQFSLNLTGGTSPCGDATPTVPAGTNCTVTVTFSPTLMGLKTANLEITSDDSNEGTVNVALSGTGMQSAVNNPPDKPELVFPANGQENLGTTVTFRWKPVTDPDGDPVTYDLYHCENNDPFNNCTSVQVASLEENTDKPFYAGFGYGGGLILFGIVFAAGFRDRKRIALLAVMFIFAGTFLVSCGSGSRSNNDRTYTVTGLNSGVTYYWGVSAKDDKDAETESNVWKFTTQ